MWKLVSSSPRKRARPVVRQQRVLDFATLASWYEENNPIKDADDDGAVECDYIKKQKNLKFLSL